MASVLTNAQEFRFKDFLLHDITESWEDELPIKLASYEYVMRDGGEQQPMGAGIKNWTLRCCFLGPDCGPRYRQLESAIAADPIGPMTHPRLGAFGSVACSGIKARENPATAIDCIEFTLSLHENQLDQSGRDNAPGVTVRAAQAQDQIRKLGAAVTKITQSRIANIVYSNVVAAQAIFGQWVDRFAAAAIAASQNSSPDVTLGKLLGTVLVKRDLFLVALAATLPQANATDVSLTPARTAAYLAYAACLQAYREVQTLKPRVVTYTVKSTMSVSQLLVSLYGHKAQQYRDDIYALNRFATPYAIPPGFVAQVIAP